MNAVGGAVQKLGRVAGRAATLTTEAAGAVGGAAVNGVVGGVTGAASGVQRGVSKGSHSTAAAGLTLGALGVAGLVEWPILLTVGGAALLIKQFNRQSDGEKPAEKPAGNATGTTHTIPIDSAKTPGKQPRSRAKPATATRSRSTRARTTK